MGTVLACVVKKNPCTSFIHDSTILLSHCCYAHHCKSKVFNELWISVEILIACAPPQVFRNGRQFEYKGPRDQEGIVRYMREQAKLPSRQIATPIEATNNLARTDANVIGYFSEKNDMYEEYIGAANELRGEWTSFPSDHLYNLFLL